ncbi:MAG: hypothetical protein HKN34_00085, partial [Gammaproteobacteria bacterium]|nr:hypothetical protein [Gammaproteobacteria bacterium]
MSLLLDALKKAAEQKARQAEADAGAGKSDDDHTESAQLKDDTIVTEDRTIEYGDRADETHTDDTEVSADPTQEVTVATQIDEDVTDVYEQDQTHRYRDKSEFNEDNTHLLEEDSTITGADAAADETFVSDVTDHTAITEINHEVEYDQLDNTVVDDTVLDSEDRTEYTETIIESPSHQDDRDVTIRSAPDEDETTPVDSDRDISDFMGDSIDDSTQSIDEDTDHTDDSFEDLSLLLVDNHDDTVHDADNDPTTKSGPHFVSGDVDTKLETTDLVDQDHKTVTQTASITADQNGNVPPGIELESLRHEHTIVRPEATSTHTYAPDNYDRTLIRPPSDDASRIFAGMKAEEDVLMTPDYAKRVFLSKYSANRMQHYKVYLGIAVSVFLAIGVFSMFELLDEYNEIDTAMLPLKRDPMPGIIRKDTTREKGNVLDAVVQPGVDMQTLKLVESAQTGAITEDTENEEAEISTSSEPPAGSED